MQFASEISTLDHPTSATEACQILNEIRTAELAVVDDDNERRQNRTSSFHRYVKRRLDHPAQVLPELLQNADDIEYCDTVEIELTDSTLWVRNNGRPMKRAEVDSLCAAGESTKHDPSFIGHFGLGFKSVFSICDTPRIRSGYFVFAFDKAQFTVPQHWEPDGQTPINGTEIELPLRSDLSSTRRDQLEERIADIPRLLTYLRNITTIRVIQDGTSTTYRRQAGDGDHEQHILKGGELDERRLVFTSSDSPSGEALEELLERRRIEDEASIRDSDIGVTLSFEVGPDDTPQSTPGECYLYNFLPTEEQSGFPFDIHADFLLDADRTALNWPEGPYNQWLLERVGDTFSTVLDYYTNKDELQMAHLQLLPSPSYTTNYLELAKQAVMDAIRETACIPGQDGQYHTPGEVFVPSERVTEVFAQSDIEHLLGQEVVYPAASIDESLLDTLTNRGLIEALSIDDLLKQSQADARAEFANADTAHLLVLAAALWEYWDDEYRNLGYRADKEPRDTFLDLVKGSPLVPLTNGERVAVADTPDPPVLPPGQHEDDYALFEDDFRLVALDDGQFPDAFEKSQRQIRTDARRFYQDVLEVNRIGPDIVCQEVIAEAFATPSDISDETLDAYLEFLVASEQRWTAAKKHVSLKFRVQDPPAESRYVDPTRTDVFLPSNYTASITSEAASDEIVGYDLVTVLDGLDATFVSDEYLSLFDGVTPERWREFMMEFGILDHLPVTETPRDQYSFYVERESIKRKLTEFPQAADQTDWSLPSSMAKGGSQDEWFPHRRRFAIADHHPSEWLTRVLDTFEEASSDAQLARAQAFDRLLQCQWDVYAETLYRPLYYVTQPKRAYEVQRTQSDRYSTVGDRLRKTPWCPTQGETRAPPQSLLVETPATANQPAERYVASPKAPYVSPLGVNTELGLDAALDLLEAAPTVWETADPPAIRQQLTSQLDRLQQAIADSDSDAPDRIVDRLADARFVYVQDADPAFRSLEHVVWQGPDLGSSLVVIGDDYSTYSELFEHLGIQETVSAADCLAYLAATAEDDDRDWRPVWRRTVRLLVSELSTAEGWDNPPPAIEQQLSRSSLMTAAGTLASLDEISWYCQHDTLRAHLTPDVAERVIAPFDREDLAATTVAELWQQLGVSDLRANATLSLTTTADTIGTPDPVHASPELKQLCSVAHSFYVDREVDTAQATVRDLFTTFETSTHEALACQHTGTDGDSVTEEFEVECYIDPAAERVYRTDTTASYQEFARRLPREIELSTSDTDDLQDLLAGALGKQDPFLESYLETWEIEWQPLEPPRPEEKEETDAGEDETPAPEVSSDESEDSSTSPAATSDTPASSSEPPGAQPNSSEGTDEPETISPSSIATTVSPTQSAGETPTTTEQTVDTNDSASDAADGADTPTNEAVASDEPADTATSDSPATESPSPNPPESVTRSRSVSSRPTRSGEFATQIRDLYDNSCAVCGAHRETPDGTPEIHAAHIRSVSNDGPDTVQNGIALCRLHHWAFDEGWLYITDDYEIRVRDWPDQPGNEELRKYNGKSLRLPDDDEARYPAQTYLQYHRQLHGVDETKESNS